MIDKNQMVGKEIEPPNNELVERVFRMASEKLSHCKSMMAFRRNIIDYFNEKDARSVSYTHLTLPTIYSV